MEAIKGCLRAINKKKERGQRRWRTQVEAAVCGSVSVFVHVCGSTYFLTFLTFMLAVLLLQERMRGSVLSSGISALLAWSHTFVANFSLLFSSGQWFSDCKANLYSCSIQGKLYPEADVTLFKCLRKLRNLIKHKQLMTHYNIV